MGDEQKPGADTKAQRGEPSTSTATKISALVGIVAAMMLAVVVNVLVARHYKRWDVTRGGLYTLSDATIQTLRALEEPVQVYVLLPDQDPLAISVRQLLEAYRAESSRVELRPTDPERHAAEFVAIQRRFGVAAGKTDDGRIVTDAQIIVARGDSPFFLTSRDLVEVDDEDDLRARPRLEQAITGAIRGVLGGERPKACFTTGHGERSIDVGGNEGAAQLRDRLVKNNYEVIEAPSVRSGEPKLDLATCRVLIIAGPAQRVPPEDVARYKTYIERGGSALIALSQEPDDDTDNSTVDLGLGDLLAVAGVAMSGDYVFELDPKLRSMQGYGETFSPTPKPHAITEGLIKAQGTGLDVVVTMASSLTPLGGAAAAPTPLLVTSDQAFGMADFFTWAKAPSPPSPGPKDAKGPLMIASATELPRPSGSSAPHGPRIVVVSSAGVVLGANWSLDELRGTATFVESAITWLAARPVMLDIPNKPAFVAGLRVSEQSLEDIVRYTAVYMPLAVALLGVAVHLRRRAGERREEPKR